MRHDTYGWSAVLPLLLACASSGARPETAASSGPIEGTYEFVANLPAQQVRGVLRVVGDTVLVDPVSEYCRPTIGPPDPLYLKYTCQGSGNYEQIQLTIDRRNPVQLSKWSATFRVQRRREVCVQYAVRDGRQVCVQTTTETYEATESRSGNLQVRRTPTQGPFQEEGLYQFSASTPNQLIRGNIRVADEGVDVQFETACQPEASTRGLPSGMPSATSVMRYYCSGTWLTFDRRNPTAAKWYAIVQVPRRREVCARYEIQNGRQVCASRTTETYDVNETRSGGIQVQRVP